MRDPSCRDKPCISPNDPAKKEMRKSCKICQRPSRFILLYQRVSFASYLPVYTRKKMFVLAFRSFTDILESNGEKARVTSVMP